MLSSRRVLRSTRRWRAGAAAGGAARAELPLALLAASEDSVCAGAAPTALLAPPPAPSFVPPRRAQRDGDDGREDAAGDPEGGDERAQREAPAWRGALEAALDALIQPRPEGGLHRRGLGADVAHERGQLGLGGGVAGERRLQRLELGGHSGIEGGLTTAHDRPLEVG